MSNWFSRFFNKSILYEKSYDGTDSYYIEGNSTKSSFTNLQLAMNHPILTGALLFVANLFAQARFEVIDKKTGEQLPDSPIIKLLNNPNFYQTRIDFLESLQFLKISQGRAIIWLKKPVGFDKPTEMYLLRDDLITWSDEFVTPLDFRRNLKSLKNEKIRYDQGVLDLEIKIGDLMFLYDLPNIGSLNLSGGYNLFEASSRLDGIRQTLVNTLDSLIAKNTILKSNGKEMLSGGGSEAPFTPDQQKKAKSMFNTGYGPGLGRSRAFITSANVTWSSMHVALRDLGLDESVKTDGNIIYTCLHIPRDVLSLEVKKTTYANFKESMTSFIQNDITAMGNDLAESIMKESDSDTEIVRVTYNHLPVMQFLDKQKYESTSAQAKALNDLLRTGVPQDVALAMVDLPITLELNPIQPLESTTQNPQENGKATKEQYQELTEALAEANEEARERN